MDMTPTEKPTSTDACSEPSSKEETQSETNEDTHEHIQVELRALLEEVQTSFRPFEQTIFSKIDAMQDKINELDNSVAHLSVTTEPVDAASGGDGSPSHDAHQADDYTSTSGP